ncbi:MAG: hypothetical protein ABIC04_05745 [Nanoarchaeota archaeon]
MKITHILAILLVVFMVACSSGPKPPAAPAEVETPVEEPVMEEPVEVAPVEEETTEPVIEPAPAGADVLFKGSEGFDPDMVTIAAGSTLSITVKSEGSSQYSFLVQGGDRTTGTKNDETAELAFEEAGEFNVMSIPFNKKLSVTVE